MWTAHIKFVKAMEEERKLLWDVLSQRVPSRHVNEWLDDSFEVGVERESYSQVYLTTFYLIHPLNIRCRPSMSIYTKFRTGCHLLLCSSECPLFQVFHTTAEDPKLGSKFSKFKLYDPLRFVIVLLNFVREDSSLILTSGERQQLTDHSPSATKEQRGMSSHGFSMFLSGDLTGFAQAANIVFTSVARISRN